MGADMPLHALFLGQESVALRWQERGITGYG